MAVLNESEREIALAELDGWSLENEVLVSTYRRTGWKDALAFVNVIGDEAERRDHHPDICITGYRNVTVRLTTHSEGGITKRDVNLARWIAEAARNLD
jgi:4a-hydroxytetrahydrobiopterin dehydratase